MALSKSEARRKAVLEEEAPVTPEVEETVETLEEEAPATSGKGVAVVSWNGGVREYSKEVHGADYKKLAAEFAEKKGGTVV